MPALSTDKFRKVSRKWVGQIGSGGVADAVVTTIPLSSSTNLPTDTGVMITIYRVDSSGTATASKEEGVVGVVSGSDIVSALRGTEGTAQAHSSGAVVEVLNTADNINDLVDGLLVEHNQSGTHKSALVTTLKATGAEINTGTEDAKIVTPKAIADSDTVLKDKTQILTSKTLTSPVINTSLSGTAILDEDNMASDSATKVPTQQSVKAYVDGKTFSLSSKLIKFTKDVSVAGDVSTTGVGFTPTTIHFMTGANTSIECKGFSDSSKTAGCVYTDSGHVTYFYDSAFYISPSGGTAAIAIVKSYDADGFTLTWSKTGSPTGTFTLYALCYK